MSVLLSRLEGRGEVTGINEDIVGRGMAKVETAEFGSGREIFKASVRRSTYALPLRSNKHVEREHFRSSPPSNRTNPWHSNPPRPMSLMPLHLCRRPDGPRSCCLLVRVNVLASQRKTLPSAKDLGSVYGEKAVACSGELYFGWLWDVSLVLEAARDAGVVLKTSGGQSFAI